MNEHTLQMLERDEQASACCTATLEEAALVGAVLVAAIVAFLVWERVAGWLLKRAGILLLLLSVLSACETVPPKSQPESLERQAADQQRGMTERYVGKLTYDQAIEKWGPPTRVVQGIRIISAQWVRHQRSAGTVPIPGPTGPVVDLPDHGDQLDTVFDKETGLLKSVHFQTW